MVTISIIREFRRDERRAPLSPNHIKILKEHYPDLQILVQPSKIRCFNDQKYEQNGALIQEDISKSEFSTIFVQASIQFRSRSSIYPSASSSIPLLQTGGTAGSVSS